MSAGGKQRAHSPLDRRKIQSATATRSIGALLTWPKSSAGNFAQEGTCTLPNGATVSFRVNDEHGGEAPGARVFAGLRMDPLFNDSTGYVETLATQRLAFPVNGANGADGWDALGIVVELDVATMLGRATGTLFAVAA